MQIEVNERSIKEGIVFFPLVKIDRSLIKDGEFLRKLSLNLKKRGFPDFLLKEELEGKSDLVVIWVPEIAAEQIIGICCDKILQDVYWRNNNSFLQF